MAQCGIFTNAEGGVSVVVMAPDNERTPLEEIAHLQSRGDIAPVDVPDVIEDHELPDRRLRGAWKRGEQGQKCGVDMVKGKDCCHEKRRIKRAAEFAPLDVEATIPAKASQAEAARQAIRDKYAAVQTDIDACTTPEELLAVLETNGL
jgi:hypothetical protein